MERQERTKYRMAESIKGLMARMPLDKITVKDIVADCGLTRQTFYRNFKDKYDLVNWYFEKLVQQSFEEMGVSLTLREGLIRKFQFLKGEQIFFTQAFRSNDCNSVVAYDYQCILIFTEPSCGKSLDAGSFRRTWLFCWRCIVPGPSA